MTENSRLTMMKRISAIYLTFLSVFCSFTLGSSDFHLITLTENYTQAKNYCRVMYTDLATIYNLADMDNLVTLASNITENAWIGLEMGAMWMWHWSLPGQVTDFFKWKSGEVITHDQEECAAMDQFGGWFVSACGVLRKFVCQGNHTGYFIFVNESKSWWDAQSHCRNLSPDLVSIHSEAENMAVLNVSASQSVWIGLFKDPWIWSDGSNSSFRFWRASQPSYLHNQDCVAAVFQDNGKWNEQNCSNQLNFVCRGGNMILIQENMTWIEALSYCRKYYFDLVDIKTKNIQDQVAQKATNATSSYVWLGLRYTVQFNFWFWIRSTSSCYQNWLPGEGPQRDYGSAVSGAMEATGGQQWVGLPETEKLNFICSTCAG
ncbi:macrophage mannose receptor 1 isoform X4 [Oreochromis aureus]|uniref:macrophage mannose receptor 1 isoform X4 n=1 Tax=Oreochromis aureus TaxID=47969 RepID=UPI0019531662|nr:macrophage mannose receptor 1 isoform X4 [Oreochromis aureus]